MSKRLTHLIMVGLIVLLSLTLVACEKERPVTTPGSRATVAPAHGTSVPTPASAVTQVAPAESGAGQVVAPAPAETPTAVAAQPVVVNPVEASGGSAQATIYTVTAGDTLASIAAKYNTTPEAIAELNGLADPNALALGQQIRIPAGASSGSAVAPAGSGTYVVQSGDTLAAIARRFGTTIAELARLNNLDDPNLVVLGQKLIVPGGGASTTTTQTGEGQKYVVQSGDTLGKIAARFGVTVQQILAVNDITNPDVISVGQVLVIP